MQIIEINPRDCTRWKYADRSHFEFGNTRSLSEDIKENGQVEPVIVRPLLNSEYKYEIIAGSRRFQACFRPPVTVGPFFWQLVPFLLL